MCIDDDSEFRHINLMIDFLNGDDRASHIVGQPVHNAGVDQEILKRDSTLCQPPWLTDEENFRFQMV